MSEYTKIAQKIKEADAILVGASNGLSITEGIHIFADNQAMHDLFGDLQAKYGLQNLLQGMIGRWPTIEQQWGFWSRMINHYSGDYQATEVMQNLKAIIGEKDYFIVTSNGEGHFELAGFDENKIFEIEGNWLHMSCSRHCCDEFVPDLAAVRKMAAAEKDGTVPPTLIPCCPHCGAPMIPTMAAGVVSEKAKRNYHVFLQKHHGKNIVILELGIGARNQLIKAPLMHLTAQEKHAAYVTVNLGEVYIANDIKEKSFGLDGYLGSILKELKEACAGEYQETTDDQRISYIE